MRKSYILNILLLAAIWGSDFMFIKIGVSSIHPLLFTSLRFLIASVCLLILVKLNKIDLKINLKDTTIVFLAAFFDTFLPQVLVSTGEKTVASGITSVILSSSPLFTFLLAHFMLKDEKITLYKLVFVITGFFGVIIIFMKEVFSPQNGFVFSGLVLITLASISYGLGVILLKQLGERMDTLKSCFYLVFTGFVLSIPFVFSSKAISQSKFLLSSTLSLIYAGAILQGFAYAFFFSAIKRFGAAKTSYLGYLVPLFGIFYGAVFLKEIISINVLIGGILIVLSAYFIEKDIHIRNRVS